MRECCATCRRRYKLMKFDYSHGGCEHTDMEGYICMAFADEKEAVWMVGISKENGMCECYVPKEENKMINEVTVRWHDGYLEEFKATEVRFGCDLLWMRLEDGKNRHIPLRSVRWFGMSQESHQSEPPKEEK